MSQHVLNFYSILAVFLVKKLNKREYSWFAAQLTSICKSFKEFCTLKGKSGITINLTYKVGGTKKGKTMGTCFKCKRSCVYVDVTKDKNIKDLFGGPCDLCRNTLCRDCSKMTSSDIRALMTQSRTVMFFCEDCICTIKQISTLQKSFRDLQENCSVLNKDLCDVKQEFQQIKSVAESAPKSYAQALANSTNALNKEIASIRASAEFISKCHDDQKKQLEATSDLLKTHNKENINLKQDIKLLESKVNTSLLKEKECNVIITGLKYRQNANVTNMARTIFDHLSLDSLQIKQCNALNKRENSPIVVKLNNKADKTTLFKRRKEIGKITAESCGLQESNIYFNEDLTVENQKLFKLARDARKQKLVQSAYTFNGSVYVKKTPTSESLKVLNAESLRIL